MRPKTSRPTVAVFTAGLLATAGAMPTLAEPGVGPDPYPGIIGKDDRKILDTWESPWSAIGRINVAGYRTKSMCTGTLIAPDLVLTAAHCLYDSRTGKAHLLSKLNFVAGVRRDKYLAHTTAKCTDTLPDYSFSAKPSLKQAAQDVAVVVLAKPLNIAPFPLAKQATEQVPDQLTSAGYARDRPFLLATDSTCKPLKSNKSLWLTDCDTNYGGSGGPVIVQENDELRVAAIMIGSAKKRFSIAVPISVWRDLPQAARSCE